MITTKPIDIEDAHADILQNALKKHLPESVRVYAFGSRANWQAKRASDLDLAIDASDILKRNIGDLEEELSQSSLPYRVDIVNLNSISNSFREAISADLVPILWDWEEVTLGEIADSNLSTINKNYPHDIIQYLDTGSITCGKIEGVQEVALTDAPSRAKRLVQNGDIIYSTVRPIQRHYGFIKNPPDNLVVSTGFSVITANTDKAYPLYLYYFLTSDDTTEALDVIAEASTSAYPSLKPSDIEAQEITLPTLPEQKAIAAVLSSLDDKIDLLHRQNKTLESIAETIFRQWFIEEADERWEKVNLSQIADITIGRTPPRKEFNWFSKNNKDIKWISIKDLGNNGIYIFNTSEYLIKNAVDKFNIPIIPRNTVILSFKMTVGRVGITTEDMLSNEAIAHFKIKDEKTICMEFIYLYLKLFKYENLGSTSSIVTSINSYMIKELPITIPDQHLIQKFNLQAKELFSKIKHNQNQIKTLESLRNTLLPKLMSGDIRVKYEAIT